MRTAVHSALSLRRELGSRNLTRAADHLHEVTYGAVPSVIYAKGECGEHGNFVAASYKRIVADAAWSSRLAKAYTASARVPWSQDRRRKELDCAVSSDALLMNIFCYPRVTLRPGVCRLLGVDAGERAEFGVRVNLAMRRGEVDRTEVDMTLGDLLVEAKLTETGFQTASMERVGRYEGLAEVFDVDQLPRGGRGVEGYQLIRGVLAAHACGGRFVLLCDRRRADLEEKWFRVLRAVPGYALRSRMALLSWQELAGVSPPALQSFLDTKYGIEPCG